jgi:hypothetical protein
MRRAIFAVSLLPVAIALACSGGKPEGAGATAGPVGDAGTRSDSPVATSEDAGWGDGAPDALSAAEDAGTADASSDSGVESGEGGCEWGGAPGECMTVTACAALADRSSFANECPGPASIECCIVTPSTADNPPVPAGWVLMEQAQVTSAMTTWAVDILNAPVTYPMFSTTTMVFGTLTVLARVEWHPPDFQNSIIHRGVTLYEPTD